MKHLILGTAGHVDHGKTALVKALTGIDCDTHKEEKARGITINLGFAYLPLPGGETIGIVDVPGHRDFVHTMVSGASAIDLALLVIAADEGIMPQTREHLQIMQVLGIGRGIVAITKTDLADDELLAMVRGEIADFVKGTFLENAPVVGVSARTGAGIDDLTQTIAAVAQQAQTRSQGEVFRMFIDRIFTVKGFGSVVTGSVLGGSIATEARAYLCPGDIELRVRRLERHGQPVERVQAGDRASLNLVGIEKADFRRGMLVADRPLRATTLLDAQARLFQGTRPLELWSQVTFLLGTFEAQARLHLIDRDRLPGGETALVQIHLPLPCVAMCGDRFIIRNSSSDHTLGGGAVIDASPLHHRRRSSGLVESLGRIAEGWLPELVLQEIRKSPGPLSALQIADALNAAHEEVSDILVAGGHAEVRIFQSRKGPIAIARPAHDRLLRTATTRIAAFHKANPLEAGGLSVEELCSSLGLDKDDTGEEFVRLMLAGEQAGGAFRQSGHTWALATHIVKPDPLLQSQLAFVEDAIRSFAMQTPVLAEIAEKARGRGIDEKRMRQVLRFLVRSGAVYEIDGAYLHRTIVDPCRKKLLEKLAQTPAGLTVAAFRDLVAGNRKICLAMYALFDKEGITRREGDVRVITEKGRKMAGQ